MIPDSYPPLRQFLEGLREDLETQKLFLNHLQERLSVYERLMEAALAEKKYAYDGTHRGEEADH